MLGFKSLKNILFSGNSKGEVSKEIQLLKEEIEALKPKHVESNENNENLTKAAVFERLSTMTLDET